VIVPVQVVVWPYKRRSAPTHLLCRTHLAHRSTGVQGVHEAESSRMQRLRVTARRKKPAGWDRQGAWGGRRTSAATRTGDREAGWAWGGNQDRRQGGRVAGRAWDSREGVGQHGGQTPATRGTACGGSGGRWPRYSTPTLRRGRFAVAPRR
jgi:hypothetical protein